MGSTDNRKLEVSPSPVMLVVALLNEDGAMIDASWPSLSLLEPSTSVRPDSATRIRDLIEALEGMDAKLHPDTAEQWYEARREGAYVLDHNEINSLLAEYPTIQQIYFPGDDYDYPSRKTLPSIRTTRTHRRRPRMGRGPSTIKKATTSVTHLATASPIAERKIRWGIRERLTHVPVATADGVVEVNDRPVRELLAIRTVVELYKRGLLDRLRQCRCRKWFYSRRADTLSCSPSCRQKKYQQADKVKAHRREYMRWYYAMYQSPKHPKKKLTFTQWIRRANSGISR